MGIFLWGRDGDGEYFTGTGWGKFDGDGAGMGTIFFLPCHSLGRTSGLTLPSTRPGMAGVMAYQSDPKRLWSFLERIGAVTRTPDRE